MNIAQINIELSSRCDRETICGFCGHQDRKTNPNLKFGDIDFALLESIAGQIPRDCIVSFHRDGDPLTHPRLGEALRLFKHHPTSIVTHGEALTKRAYEIIDNCTTVTVSVIPKDKDRDIQIKSIEGFLYKKMERKPQVQLKFVGDIENPEAYAKLRLPIIGRALHVKPGNWKYHKAVPLVPEIRVCLDFLGRPTIDWRGRVFCCNRLDTMDAGLIGDLTKDTLSNIWNGPIRRKMLEAHLSGHRENANSLCKDCTYWGIPVE